MIEQMNPQEVLSIANQVKDLVAVVAPVLVLILTFLYVRGRAGSAVFLLDRLWRVLGGKKDFHDPTLQEEHNKLSDFEKFNYCSGIRFQSHKRIGETKKWLEEHGIGIEELVRVRGYYNCKNPGINPPRIIRYQIVFGAMLALFIFGTAIASIGQVPAALLTVKKTGTVIWASTTEVRSWDGFSWVVTPDHCSKGVVPLGEHDTKVVCDIFTEEGVEHALNKTMFFQKSLSILIWIVVGFLTSLSARQFSIANQALDLHERSTKSTPSQMELSI